MENSMGEKEREADGGRVANAEENSGWGNNVVMGSGAHKIRNSSLGGNMHLGQIWKKKTLREVTEIFAMSGIRKKHNNSKTHP